MIHLSSDDGKPGASRRRQIVAYSGAPVYRYDLLQDREFMLKLSLEPGACDATRLVGGPLLLDHERKTGNVIAVVERAWIEGGQLRAVVRFGTDAASDAVFQRVEDGLLRNISVEAGIRKLETTRESVAGLPLKVATRWEPEALSLVPVGADRNARIGRALEAAAKPGAGELETARRKLLMNKCKGNALSRLPDPGPSVEQIAAAKAAVRRNAELARR